MLTTICWLTFSSYVPAAGVHDVTVRVDTIQAVQEYKADESIVYIDGKAALHFMHSREEVLIMMQEDCNGMD